GRDATAGLVIEATIGAGVALTDERRLVEAEAVLRGAVAAAGTIHDQELAAAAGAALSRALLWQGRHDEAVATASPHRERTTTKGNLVRLLAILARAHARLGRTALAVRTARDAQQEAGGADPRVQAAAELSLAEALGGAGDAEGARAAL